MPVVVMTKEEVEQIKNYIKAMKDLPGEVIHFEKLPQKVLKLLGGGN